MMIGIAIVLFIYLATILTNVVRTNRLRKRLKPGDSCSVYHGEVRIRAFVLGVSKEIEVKVFNRVMLFPRNLIYA
ncbi:MAG: hypothetical protein FJY07_02335 [Bacteroidetes bacterium]|nr:hypothetical protein [Bacteroidota bacterium]